MSLLANVKTDSTVNAETDFIGGGGVWDSGLYPFEITMAYLEKKVSGALFLNLDIKSDSGKTHRENMCLASGDAKGNKNFYENAKGERNYLPGFNTANSIGLLCAGKEVGELDTEMKLIGVYNFEAKKEIMTEKEVVTELLGKRGVAGVQKQIVDKNVKGDDGKYHASGEVRETNEIDKVFREKDLLTTAEIIAKAEEPKFYHIWDGKFTGVTLNKASAANDANGASGAPAKAAGASTKPTKTLFGN
jgi:hypothetical protein